MNTTPSETARLANAVAGLAATIAEIIDARCQKIGEAMEQKVAEKTLQPMFTKKQAAEVFGVTVRTIESWMRHGYLPYFKIGYIVRIPMKDAESCLRERCYVRRRL